MSEHTSSVIIKIKCPLKISIMGYVFCASDYNKMWCSLQKQTHVVVLCKNVTNMWCYVLFSQRRRRRRRRREPLI
jgi:hypothetical protein